MIKSSKFGDSVAAEMDKILSDESFKSIFAKATPEYSQAINQDPSYQAFVRIAKKQEKCECKKGKCVCKDDKKKDKKEDKKDKKKDKVTKKAEEEVLALKYIYDTIISASEALDNMGLSKSASSALVLLDGIIKEAQFTEPGVPFESNKGKLEQPKNTNKIPETTPPPVELANADDGDGDDDDDGEELYDDSWNDYVENREQRELYEDYFINKAIILHKAKIFRKVRQLEKELGRKMYVEENVPKEVLDNLKIKIKELYEEIEKVPRQIRKENFEDLKKEIKEFEDMYDEDIDTDADFRYLIESDNIFAPARKKSSKKITSLKKRANNVEIDLGPGEAQITDPDVPFESNKGKLEQLKNTTKFPETTPMPEPTFPPGEDVDIDLSPGFGTREKPIRHKEPPATNLKPNRPSTFDDSLRSKKPEVKPMEVGASIKDKNIIALFNKINKWTKEG